MISFFCLVIQLLIFFISLMGYKTYVGAWAGLGWAGIAVFIDVDR